MSVIIDQLLAKSLPGEEPAAGAKAIVSELSATAAVPLQADDAKFNIAVYIFWPVFFKRGKKDRQLKNLFNPEIFDIKRAVNNQTIFLNQQTALQYGRFMDEHHVILKVYVPESTIQGNGQVLTLKPGVLQLDRIQGCFPGWQKEPTYFANPSFNVAHLPN